MYNNDIDLKAFQSGFQSSLDKAAAWNFSNLASATPFGAALAPITQAGGVVGDWVRKKVTDVGGGLVRDIVSAPDTQKAIQDSFTVAAQKTLENPDVQKAIGSAGETAGAGALRGGLKQFGYDPDKSLGDNAQGWGDKAWNALGLDSNKGVMDNLGNAGNALMNGFKNHPIAGTLLSGAGLFGGYQLGKSFGLWGNDNNNNNNNNNQNNSGFSKAYTNNTPQALTKAGSTPGLNLGMSVPPILNGPLALGTGLYGMANAGVSEDTTGPAQVNVNPAGTEAQKALADPRMQQYITNLVDRTYSQA